VDGHTVVDDDHLAVSRSSADPSLLSSVIQREVPDMTLPQFKTITGSATPSALRRAMAIALAVEPVDGPEAYERFYGRVIAELGLTDKRWAEAPRGTTIASRASVAA
jgi:hypothetical protein